MSTSESHSKDDENSAEEDALEELIDEYADVVSELAGRDSSFADRLRELRDGGTE